MNVRTSTAFSISCLDSSCNIKNRIFLASFMYKKSNTTQSPIRQIQWRSLLGFHFPGNVWSFPQFCDTLEEILTSGILVSCWFPWKAQYSPGIISVQGLPGKNLVAQYKNFPTAKRRLCYSSSCIYTEPISK